jgi:hypothetical protein
MSEKGFLDRDIEIIVILKAFDKPAFEMLYSRSLHKAKFAHLGVHNMRKLPIIIKVFIHTSYAIYKPLIKIAF